jgi:DnaJ-domain-containing protein 1
VPLLVSAVVSGHILSRRKLSDSEFFAARANHPITPGPSRFLSGFEELLGDDSEPDPQFFVECWTLGVPEAIGNLQFRLRVQADRDEENMETGLLEELFTSVLPRPGVWHFDFSERSEFARNVAMPRSTTDGRGEDGFAEKCAGSGNAAYPMTLERARQLLGVSVASTSMQIKAAFRQKVREWHPDRLSDQNKVARQFANEKMTEINEAYRLLRIPVV